MYSPSTETAGTDSASGPSTPTTPPPTNGAAHSQHPPGRSRWIVLAREDLAALLGSLDLVAELSPSVRREVQTAIIERCGHRNPQTLPYLLLFERPGPARAVAMARNLDGLLADLLFAKIQELGWTASDDGFAHAVWTHVHPVLQQRLTQQARLLVDEAIEDLAGKWNLPEPAEARRSQRAEAFAHVVGPGASVLPEDVYAALEAVLDAAQTAVHRRGLNPEQLFADGHLGTILQDHPAWLAFSGLPEAYQEEARRWLVCTLGWQGCYLPEWMRGKSLEERQRIVSAPEGGES